MSDSFSAVSSHIASWRRIDTQGVDPVAVELSLNDGAVARVEILGHAVEMQFVNNLVSPRMSGQVENDGFAAVAITNGVALVAWSYVEVETGGSKVDFVLVDIRGDSRGCAHKADRSSSYCMPDQLMRTSGLTW